MTSVAPRRAAENDPKINVKENKTRVYCTEHVQDGKGFSTNQSLRGEASQGQFAGLQGKNLRTS